MNGSSVALLERLSKNITAFEELRLKNVQKSSLSRVLNQFGHSCQAPQENVTRNDPKVDIVKFWAVNISI